MGFAFDDVRGVAVLAVGWTNCSYGAGGDTMEWDGAEWHDFNTSYPDGRGAEAFLLAYNSDEGVVMGQGGWRCVGDSPRMEESFCEIHSWDEDSWETWYFPEGRCPGSPPPRNSAGVMVYDSWRHEMVVIGSSTWVMRTDGWHLVD